MLTIAGVVFLEGCAALKGPKPEQEDPCIMTQQEDGEYSLEELARRYECQKRYAGESR